MSSTRARPDSDAPSPLWARPVWLDPKAMRDVERAVVVDALRRDARAAMVGAMQRAGIWDTGPAGPRRAVTARSAVQLAAALHALAPDAYSDLLLANARMAARELHAAERAFVRLTGDATCLRIRAYAQLGAAVVAGLRQQREVGFARCRAAIGSAVDDVALRGALSLVVQSAIAGNGALAAYALDALVARGGEGELARAADALGRSTANLAGERGRAALCTLRTAGRRGDAVLAHLRREVAP